MKSHYDFNKSPDLQSFKQNQSNQTPHTMRKPNLKNERSRTYYETKNDKENSE